MHTSHGLDMIHVAAYPEGLALLCGRCVQQIVPPAPGLHTLAQLIEAAMRHVHEVHRPDVDLHVVKASDFEPVEPDLSAVLAHRIAEATAAADFSQMGAPRTPAPCFFSPPAAERSDSSGPVTERDDPAGSPPMPPAVDRDA